MNNHTKFFQLNVGFIAQQSIGYGRDFPFEIPEISLESDLDLKNLIGEVVVSRTSEGLLVQTKFKASTKLTCVRCLNDFDQALAFDFAELFVFPSHADEDTDLILPEDGNIDLGPLVREYMVLEIPINPICEPDCKGLCPECGANLNTEPCGHKNETIDPRLASLKSLLDEDE